MDLKYFKAANMLKINLLYLLNAMENGVLLREALFGGAGR
jgi:hypothetical protein